MRRIDIKEIVKLTKEEVDWFDKNLIIGGIKNPHRPDLERGLLLYWICKKIGAKKALDIGTANYFSAKSMAKYGCKVDTIDIKEQKLRGNDELHPLINHIVGDSRYIVPRLGQYDIIFIDGSHDYEPVKEDIKNAMKLTDLIVCHDYGNLPDVTKAIDETINPTYYIADDRLWYGAAYEKTNSDREGNLINYGLVVWDKNNVLGLGVK